MINAYTATIVPTGNPISVTLPDGRKVQYTSKYTLDLPDLPITARNGHIIPGLASNSLISVVVLCNTGCKATFNKHGVTVKCIVKTVLRGTKCART